MTDPSDSLPQDLIDATRNIYKPSGLKISTIGLREAESLEYNACRFGLNGRSIAFRVAKTTPTKIGQFVTLWKRPSPHTNIAPLDTSDGLDFVIVSVFDTKHRGQFVFDQKLLVTKGIMSQNHKGGKRAIRVYPPWSKPVAKEAIKTQLWQVQYFFPIAQNGTADSEQVRKLFKV